MIILIAGPSGSGKTTLINYVIKNTKISFVRTYVYSETNRDYSDDSLRIPISKKRRNTLINHNAYSKNTYLLNQYFYKVPSNKSKIYLFDYPGEYPDCVELKDILYIGVLILPPSIDALKSRLKDVGREDRIDSAILEYQECLMEIENKAYDESKWFILYNDEINDSYEKIDYIVEEIYEIFCKLAD